MILYVFLFVIESHLNKVVVSLFPLKEVGWVDWLKLKTSKQLIVATL